MIFPAIEKHKQLYSTEDWLFTCMRILVVAGSVAFYALVQIGAITKYDIPNLLLKLSVFVIWSALVVWSIFRDVNLRSQQSAWLKRWLVGVSLPIDGIFIYYAAKDSEGIFSPFFYAVFVLIVFHAYYFPNYFKGRSSKKYQLLTSGSVSGLALFILLYLGLAEKPALNSFDFYVDSFLAFILAITAGLLRQKEIQKSDELQRSNELANLFRGIIGRMNKMHANGEEQGPLFDDLATTIGENLSAMACEVFALDSAGVFIRKGMWLRTSAKSVGGFQRILAHYDTIILGSEYDASGARARRVGRYDEQDPHFQANQNHLSEKMAVYLSEENVKHSLFTLILKPKQDEHRQRAPIGIIRVTNRLDGYGEVKGQGFSAEDEEVIEDVAKEIAGAFESYQLQLLLSKTAERESYLKQLALQENLDQIMPEILQNMSMMVEAKYAELWTPFNDGFAQTPKLVLRAHSPIKGHVLDKLGIAERIIDVDNSFIGKAHFGEQKQNGIAFREDISKEKDFAWRHLLEDFGTNMFISIPLKKGDEILGVACLHPQKDLTLSTDLRQKLEEFANLAAVSLQSARLRRRFVQLKALHRHLDALLVEDEDLFYHNIAYLVRDVVEARECSLYMLTGDNGDNELRGHSYLGEGKDRANWRLPKYDASSIVKRVIKQNVSVVCSENNSSAVKAKKVTQDQQKIPLACMACPVPDSRNGTIAVIYCKEKINSPNIVTKTFSNSDLELFELAVGIIGAIMENRLNLMRLEEINARRRNFLSSVTHEFTSPLQSIRMTAEYLKKYHANPERLKNPDAQFDFLIEEVDFLNYLTANIRTQFSEGVYEFKGSPPVRTKLFSLVERIQTLLKSQAKEKGLDIKLLGSFPVLKVDQFHLEQVVFNLLVNAIKYTLPTSPKPIIEIVCEDRHPHLLLMFRNWGIGVRQNEAARIFEMFVRGTEAHEGSVTGTGLGLYISKRIMQKMGGDLLLTKLVNPTEFTVFVPKL